MLGIKVLTWKPDLPFPTSPLLGTAWQIPSVVARCGTRPSSGQKTSIHEVPAEDCNCGVHALSALWILQYYIYGVIQADAEQESHHMFACLLEASGKVILHETGWRAEAVDIIGVCSFPQELPDRQAFHLTYKAASHFVVPILNFSELSDVLTWSYQKSLKLIKAGSELERLF